MFDPEKNDAGPKTGKQFCENAGDVCAVDVSPERLVRLQDRLTPVFIAADLLRFQQKTGVPTVFDPELPVPAFYTDAGAASCVALNPALKDAMLASFLDHELRHLMQWKSFGMFQGAHPLLVVQNILLMTFMNEADAYLHQRLFAIEAWRKDDREIAPFVVKVTDENMSAFGLFDLTDPVAQEDLLNKMFWTMMGDITKNSAYHYFTAAMEQAARARTLLGSHDKAMLEEIDRLPQDFDSCFADLRKVGQIRLSEDGPVLNYLRNEQGVPAFNRVFRMLPEELRQEAIGAKREFLAAFYAEMDKKNPGSKPQLRVPGR